MSGTGTFTAMRPASFTQWRGSGDSVKETSTWIPCRRSHVRSAADSGIASAAKCGRSIHEKPGAAMLRE
jgi:hypothetical protein